MSKSLSIQNFNCGSYKMDIRPLVRAERELKKHFHVEVGVIGAKAARKNKENGSKETNASIGMIHEFGQLTRKPPIPQRSFLRMPLWMKLPEKMKGLGQDLINSVTAGNIRQVYKKLGLMAEGIIKLAFNSRGYGQWAPNAPSTIRRKGSDMPLIDTGELRKAISSRVVEG